MLLDLTGEISLKKENIKVYVFLRIVLYLVALAIGAFLIFRLFFPIGSFTFSFINFNSNKNTLSDPRNSKGDSLERGIVKSSEKLIFDASLVGNYSKALLSFDLSKNSALLGPENKLSFRKSYRAFLFPEGDAVGFKDGSWVRSGDDFYFVSNGKLRKFTSQKILLDLGFSRENFLEVAAADLEYNSLGEDISDNYPEGTVFRSGDSYYLLEGETLRPFISEAAFLSQNFPNQVISVDDQFLSKFSFSENPVGFSEGSLIAYGEAAYVVGKNEIFPIGDPTIFEAAGFVWDDLINVSGDQVAMYEKGDMFSLSSVHPDGTIFFDKDQSRNYLITNQEKHLLPSNKIASSWIRKTPITVDSRSLASSGDCVFQRNRLDLGKPSYSCDLSLEQVKDFLGKDYEFVFSPGSDIDLDQADVTFKRTVDKENFRQSLFEIINRIKRNYVGE